MSSSDAEIRPLVTVPGPPRFWWNVETLNAQRYGSRFGRNSFATQDKNWALNPNHCLAQGLTLARSEGITHLLMLGTDVHAEGLWGDALIDVLAERDADFVSVPCPIDDGRGVTSSGVADLSNPYRPLKRFTVRELLGMPETFDAAESGWKGLPLLHNWHCCAWDLRKVVHRRTERDGGLSLAFNFPQRIVETADGSFAVLGTSEDWEYSRALFRARAKTVITRRVKLWHRAPGRTNAEPWGDYRAGDEDTKAQWTPRPRAATS